MGGNLFPDIAWHYRHPTPESAKIAAHICFFNELVDALYVDGELMPTPKTKWSLPEPGKAAHCRPSSMP